MLGGGIVPRHKMAANAGVPRSNKLWGVRDKARNSFIWLKKGLAERSSLGHFISPSAAAWQGLKIKLLYLSRNISEEYNLTV